MGWRKSLETKIFSEFLKHLNCNIVTQTILNLFYPNVKSFLSEHNKSRAKLMELSEHVFAYTYLIEWDYGILKSIG